MKSFDPFGNCFWHIFFPLEDFSWNLTQSFRLFLRGELHQSTMSSYTLSSNGRIGDGCSLCREYFN